MKNQYKIEHGIPVPEYTVGGRKSTYPFDKMEVGDSVLIKDREPTCARQSAYQWAFRIRGKVTVRKEGKGIRVWRIK